jgi:hypothetical protein
MRIAPAEVIGQESEARSQEHPTGVGRMRENLSKKVALALCK